jgi:hypothetical protein
MAPIGEVVRLTWPTVSGLITLVALTPNGTQLERVECEPTQEMRETFRLYRLLWDHAHESVTPPLPVAERPSLRLVS